MKEETRDVNLFLKKDFWHYINLGGINYNQLSSPQLTFTPNTHSYTNGTEKRLIDDMSEAERSTYVATTIIIAFKDCTDIEGQRHKSILEDYYIKEYNTMFPNGYNKRWNTSFQKILIREKNQNSKADLIEKAYRDIMDLI